MKKHFILAGIFTLLTLGAAETPVVLLEHNFTNGWQKMDKENFSARIQIQQRGRKPTAVTGKNADERAMRLYPESQIVLRNARPKVPGAIVLQLKCSGKLTEQPARYIGTTNRPGPYLFYQESISLKKPFFHCGSHNLRPPAASQYNITHHGSTLPENVWNTIVINLKKNVIELWINGKKFQGAKTDFLNNDLYGDIAIGSQSNKFMTLDIASLRVFGTALSDAEIAELSKK